MLYHCVVSIVSKRQYLLIPNLGNSDKSVRIRGIGCHLKQKNPEIKFPKISKAEMGFFAKYKQ